MFRTKKLMEIMKKISNTKFSKFLSISSLILGPILIALAVFFLFFGILTKTPTYAPALPGISYGPITLPIIQTIIAIFIAAFIHEFAHGILVYKNNLDLKSWGFFYLGPLIGAFVEPDEKEIEKLNKKEQIKIYSAGAAINIIAGLIFLFLFFFFTYIISMFNLATPYVKILYTLPNTYAYNVIPNNTILYSINGNQILYLNQIGEVLNNTKPGEYVLLNTSAGLFNIELTNKDGKPFIGIVAEQEYNYKVPVIDFIQSLLFWLFVINVGLGIGNMIPIYPLDGGKTMKSILEIFLDKKRSRIVNLSLSIILLALILYNISFIF
ncbi:putative membrane-associated Zn-dependent protease [Candidatus Nanobsidianus stetteri]|uniref:Putative membrane-associated Zn-dependent protease n=1 Tax=Nanobsidianus stetteri TaxID=1294122 RepID=R1G394_NANST|nr:putative membrane-associated Zn-dependent protease [Candidatus Nanobsidianus stetteri]